MIQNSTQTSQSSSEKMLKFVPHRWQEKALQSCARFVLLVSGTQAGKTTLGAWWMLFQILSSPTKNHLILAPTYKILSQSTLPKFLDIVLKLPLGQWREQDKEFRLNEGGRVFVRSADDPLNIEAMTLKSVWADEAGRMKRQVWPVLNSRVAIEKGNILFTTTPYSLNWIYTEIYKRWVAGDKDYDVIQFRSIDSPYFPREEYIRARQTFSPEEFSRRFEGQFIKPEGLVYPDVLYLESVPEKFDQMWAGLDLGLHNPTAFILFGAKDEKIYAIEEYFASQKSTPEHAQEIKKILAKYNQPHTIIYCDPAAAQSIKDLHALGLNTQPAKHRDVNAGINYVRSLFHQKRLYICSSLNQLSDEFANYSYKEDSDDIIKEKDHGMDALRYALTSIVLIKKETNEAKKKRLEDVIFSDIDNEPEIDRQSAITGYY